MLPMDQRNLGNRTELLCSQGGLLQEFLDLPRRLHTLKATQDPRLGHQGVRLWKRIPTAGLQQERFVNRFQGQRQFAGL